MTRPTRGERGFVLLIVLWTVAVLALMTSALVTSMRTETRLIAGLRGAAIASAAADAAVSATIANVLRSPGDIPTRRRIGEATVAIRLEDLSGRVNPNVATVTMLRGLLLGIGVAPAAAESIAAAIVDWRTPGLTGHAGSLKAEPYRAAGLTYGPAGRPFEHLDELGAVLGVTPTLLAAMMPHLTLWSTGDPDPGYADAIVIAALRGTGVPPVASRSSEARIIAITASASAPGAPLVIRRAVVRFGFSPDGRAWRVLAWDDGDPSDR